MSVEIEMNNLDNHKLQFLNHKSSYSNCYVCLNETNYLSPCKCKTSICNNCFKNILINNGKKCTICKENFDNNILDNIKIIIPELEIEENSSNNSSEEEDDNIIRDLREQDKLTCCKIILFVFSIPTFGWIINSLMKIEQPYLFSLANFLIGLFVWIFIGILYSICSLIIYIFNQIHDFFGFYYRYFLLR